MVATESKIITYLGFSIKAKKIVFGLDNAEKMKRGELMLLDEALSENSKKQAIKIAEKLNCPVLSYQKNLSDILHKEGCKLAVVTDKNLAQAVFVAAEGSEDFCLIQEVGGNK